jgi:heme/copper-type cytochrome/quinol oxidase subunit 4
LNSSVHAILYSYSILSRICDFSWTNPLIRIIPIIQLIYGEIIFLHYQSKDDSWECQMTQNLFFCYTLIILIILLQNYYKTFLRRFFERIF